MDAPTGRPGTLYLNKNRGKMSAITAVIYKDFGVFLGTVSGLTQAGSPGTGYTGGLPIPGEFGTSQLEALPSAPAAPGEPGERREGH